MRISRRGEVDPFIVMDVMEAARQQEANGRHIIHMEVGQPATGAPKPAIEALTTAMQNGPLGYTVALGLPELRAKIAQLYQEWYGIDLPADRVVVTAGSSAGFLLSFISLFETGEKVAIGDPGYPSYRNILKSLGLNPVRIETGAETRFQPDPKHLDGLDVQGLLVASPSNPTGTMLDKTALTALIDACAARNIGFISDEIYHGIDYGKRAVSALEISDDVYVINSFSKFFSMTGWRVGWMVVPESHVRRIERLSQNLFICPSHASQIAALHALDCQDDLQENCSVYAANRKILIDGLPKAGFGSFAPPDGAFYIYADVSDRTENSRELATQILIEAGVAVTPGLDFDPVRGHKTLRFSYAGSTDDMIEGVNRLIAWHQKTVS
ncbi:MAG: aminotransferase class I/II-fold pyridoxal phosphate-dependent enzyme [Rhodobacteraceae bacterium]|nr:aminotransferase class I/II-fold pyridoxal phosphate-dependent enzyme [Paracoccaceae bacterium]